MILLIRFLRAILCRFMTQFQVVTLQNIRYIPMQGNGSQQAEKIDHVSLQDKKKKFENVFCVALVEVYKSKLQKKKEQHKTLPLIFFYSVIHYLIFSLFESFVSTLHEQNSSYILLIKHFCLQSAALINVRDTLPTMEMMYKTLNANGHWGCIYNARYERLASQLLLVLRSPETDVNTMCEQGL